MGNVREINNAIHPLTSLVAVSGIGRCINKCVMCLQSRDDFHFANSREEINLDPTILRKALDEAPSTLKNVGLSSYRETMLQPNILDYFAIALERGFSTVFETSGVIYNEEFFIRCMDMGITRILISLNAPTRDTYKRLHGRDNFERVIRNMESLLELREKHNFPTEIHTHIMMYKECVEHYRAFRAMWADRLDRVYLQGLCNWGDDRWTSAAAPRHGLTEIRVQMGERRPCPSLHEVMVLAPDGGYYLCGMAYKHHVTGKPVAALGNARTTTITEAWERVHHYRELHRQGRYDEVECCAGCNAWMTWIMYVDDVSEEELSNWLERGYVNA